jgi:large subunit ribosomal protein L25
MSDAMLTATPRTEFGSPNARRLRLTGQVPAVVYGLETDTLEIAVNARDLANLLGGAGGANTLITLKLDGGDQLALTRQIERHPVRGELLHVDFVRVRRDTEVAAEVGVHLLGEPIGVIDGGLLDQILFSVSVMAKPDSIPNAIEVDVTGLALGDQLHISNLPQLSGVRYEHEADELVAQISVPRGIEEEGGEGEGAASDSE